MKSFRGNKFYLSNMYPCTVKINVNGKIYTMKSSETVFQALRCPERIDEFLTLDGFAAKKLSHTCKQRPDWNMLGPNGRTMDLEIMLYALRCKFAQNPELAVKLLALDGDIVEINEWNDTYWGVCNNHGKNNLGKLLMLVRDELKLK